MPIARVGHMVICCTRIYTFLNMVQSDMVKPELKPCKDELIYIASKYSGYLNHSVG